MELPYFLAIPAHYRFHRLHSLMKGFGAPTTCCFAAPGLGDFEAGVSVKCLGLWPPHHHPAAKGARVCRPLVNSFALTIRPEIMLGILCWPPNWALSRLSPFLSLHVPETPEDVSALALLLSKTPPLPQLGASYPAHSPAQALTLLSHCPSIDFSS